MLRDLNNIIYLNRLYVHLYVYLWAFIIVLIFWMLDILIKLSFKENRIIFIQKLNFIINYIVGNKFSSLLLFLLFVYYTIIFIVVYIYAPLCIWIEIQKSIDVSLLELKEYSYATEDIISSIHKQGQTTPSRVPEELFKKVEPRSYWDVITIACVYIFVSLIVYELIYIIDVLDPVPDKVPVPVRVPDPDSGPDSDRDLD
jgi:hypothetical protein